jgi:hypothetical protein
MLYLFFQNEHRVRSTKRRAENLRIGQNPKPRVEQNPKLRIGRNLKFRVEPNLVTWNRFLSISQTKGLK